MTHQDRPLEVKRVEDGHDIIDVVVERSRWLLG